MNWTQGNYGIETFRAAGFTGSVAWASDGGGYEGKFNGWKLKAKFTDREAARQAVEALARRKATELLEALKGTDR
jgi:hypothetical protein